MSITPIEGARLREVNGRSHREWVATGITFPRSLMGELDRIATEYEVPRNSVVVYLLEHLLAIPVAA